MHLLALTAGAALASIAPATAPPGDPPAGAVPAGTYTLEDSFGRRPLHRDVDGAGGLDATSPQFNALWAFDDTAYIIPIWLELTNNVPVDNCAWKESDVTTVATAAELAAAMAEQRGSLVSAPEPLQIGSYSGVVFTAAPIPGTDCDMESGSSIGRTATRWCSWTTTGTGGGTTVTGSTTSRRSWPSTSSRGWASSRSVPTHRCCRRINASCSPSSTRSTSWRTRRP